MSNDMLAFTVLLRFREPRLVFTPRGAQKSEGEKGSPINQCRFAWHTCVCLLTMWGHNMKSKQPGVWPCLASKIPRDCVRSPWQSEVFTGRDFQTGCIGCTLRFATVAQVAQSMLSHWAQLHGRWDKVCGLRSLASLPITGRRWTSEPQRRLDRNRLGPNGFKWIQVLQMLRAYPMPIPCLSHALSTYSTWTPLGHPLCPYLCLRFPNRFPTWQRPQVTGHQALTTTGGRLKVDVLRCATATR